LIGVAHRGFGVVPIVDHHQFDVRSLGRLHQAGCDFPRERRILTLRRVRVFGSFARGDASEDSDVDLLIEAGPLTPPWFPGGLLVGLEEALGRRVDVAEESTLHPLIRDRVLHEAIPL
jgi:predicted nucleotidyltransferase